jgi:hypothetical protein
MFMEANSFVVKCLTSESVPTNPLVPKFCKDCAFNREQLYCNHPMVVLRTSSWDVVKGDLNVQRTVLTSNGKQTDNCYDLRAVNGTCGLEAKLFEQKPAPDYSCHPA